MTGNPNRSRDASTNPAKNISVTVAAWVSSTQSCCTSDVEHFTLSHP